ncbi:unnamed protein product [Phaedon cochleariae]|uniref:Transposase n=1 Tax=Phaedon cochleariae TaxID=80249 RepID=A0A9N9X5D9_PHACE|nr:unnamed protein product [Phaedon cochleariae]
MRVDVELMFECLIYINAHYFPVFMISEVSMTIAKYISEKKDTPNLGTDAIVCSARHFVELLKLILFKKLKDTHRKKGDSSRGCASLTNSLISLEHRRKVGDLALFYRYFYGRCSSEISTIVPPLAVPARSTRRVEASHPFVVTLETCRTSLSKDSFIQRTARLWNTLPRNSPNHSLKQSILERILERRGKVKLKKCQEKKNDDASITDRKRLHIDATWRKIYCAKKAADLTLKYSSDLDPYEFVNELESFKFQACAMFTDLDKMNALDIRRKMRVLSLQTIYPNLDTALRIFLTIGDFSGADLDLHHHSHCLLYGVHPATHFEAGKRPLVSYHTDENPHVTVQNRQQGRFSFNVWVGIFRGQFIGPYIYDGPLNSREYLDILMNQVEPFLEDIPINLIPRVVFQHDGAPAHCARIINDYLNVQFGEKWMGYQGPIQWPARSPDLTPLDFLLWGRIRDLTYKNNDFNSREELERVLRGAFNQVLNIQLINAVNAVTKRCRICLQQNGGQFEHLLT